MAVDLRDAPWMDDVWAERNTTPAAIQAALGELLRRHGEKEASVPARALNLVAVVDREWRGEVQNRLERVGRYQPSRSILCAAEPQRESLDAWATMTMPDGPPPGVLALSREQVMVDVGPHHLEHLDSIVDPLLVTDLPTVVWAPHGHPEAVDSLMRLAQAVLIDSVNEPDPAAGVLRARELAERADVVDLAWLRSAPWRERVAATFDPATWRPELSRISSIAVSHRSDSRVAGALFLGWLVTRLGWEPGSLLSANGSLYGRARGPRQEVALRLEPDPDERAPGLSSITVDTASGMSVSLHRGPGGLAARRRTAHGHESSWTVLGASRGESGILGEGIRHTLLHDPIYRPALAAAEGMLA